MLPSNGSNSGSQPDQSSCLADGSVEEDVDRQVYLKLRDLRRENERLRSRLEDILGSNWWRLGAKLDRLRMKLGLKKSPRDIGKAETKPIEEGEGESPSSPVSASGESPLGEMAQHGADEHLNAILSARNTTLEALAHNAPGMLFLVPFLGQGGGLHSIVQEVAAMRLLGFRAAVAIPENLAGEYQAKYPDLAVFETFKEPLDLLQRRTRYGAFVATYFTSVALLERLWLEDPSIVCGYYVQDYEPWFFEGGSEWERIAYRTYGSIPGMIHFAKTDFLCQTLEERHGIECRLVSPGLDRTVYVPPGEGEKPERPLVVTAMVRPNTPWRRPELTMRVLRSLQREFGDKLSIEVFGCRNDDPAFEALPKDFQFKNLEILSRQDVSALLRRASVFLDLSIYQAFGRTGLEAMASGCVPVLPEKCGPDSYARQHHNAILINTGDEQAAFEAVRELLFRPDFRRRLAESGLETAKKFSVPKAALEECLLFVENQGSQVLSGQHV